VRALIRSDADVRLLITHADRAFIEEVHFGSTPEEARRIWWDICWIWGPPEDHLATLLDTIGPSGSLWDRAATAAAGGPASRSSTCSISQRSTGVAIESGNVKTIAA